MFDRRLSDRMLNCWNIMKGRRIMPTIEALNPALIYELWPYCIRIRVINTANSSSYIYEYVGEEVAAAYGKNLTGEQLLFKGLVKTPAESLESMIGECSKIKAPVCGDGKFINLNSRTVKYRSCIMPFSSDNQNVTHLVAGFSWQVI